MEAEKILQCLLKDSLKEDILTDLKRCLHPLFTSKINNEITTRHQPYAMKILKSVIEKLSTQNSKHVTLLFQMADLCTRGLETSFKRFPIDTKVCKTSYCFEKLLLNLAKHASKYSNTSIVILCYNTIYGALVNESLKREGEVASLLTSLANVLWDAGNRLANQQITKLNKVLELYRNSIKVYLLLIPSQLGQLLKLAKTCDNQILKISGNESHETWLILASFHEYILKDSQFVQTLDKMQLNCQLFTSLIEWLLIANQANIKIKDNSRIKLYTNEIQKLLQNHVKSCRSNCHVIYNTMICLHQILPFNNTSFSRLFEISPNFQISSLSLPQIVSCTGNFEFLITEIRDYLETSTITLHFNENDAIKLFNFVVKIVQLNDECLQVYIDHSSSEETPIISKSVILKRKRLSGINFLIKILLSLILFLKSSSSCSDASSIFVNLITKCLPFLKSAESILEEDSNLSFSENNYLGVNAYNLSAILCQLKCFKEAWPFLHIACRQLLIYCQFCGNNVWEEMQQFKLYEKFSLLIKTLLKEEEYDVAMETIEMMMSSLNSTNQSQEQITACINQFVYIKCTAKSQLDSTHLILTKNSCDWLTSCHDDNLKCLCLKEELKMYQVLNQDTRAWQFSVAKQLTTLYPKRSHDFCWIAIKLASLNISFSSSSAMGLLNECIDILQSFKDGNMIMTFDLLGLAHFWKGLYLHVLSTRDLFNESDHVNVVKSQLTTALEYWCKIEQFINKDLDIESCFIDYNSTLHHILLCSSFSQSLLYTDLSLSLLNILLSLSSYHSSIAATCDNNNNNNKDPLILYCQGLAMKTQLLLTNYGIQSITPSFISQLKEAEKKSTNNDNDNLILGRLMCRLQLSHLYIRNGEVEKGGNLLKTILSHPILDSLNQSSLLLSSMTTSIVSYYLQCVSPTKSESSNSSKRSSSKNTPLNESSQNDDRLEELLSYYTNEVQCSVTNCPCKNMSKKEERNKTFLLTDLEVSMINLKFARSLMFGLTSRHSPKEDTSIKEENQEGEGRGEEILVSGCIPAYKTWEITSLLLESLLNLSQLFLGQGVVKECERFVEEGLTLAKKLNLTLWEIKFLIHKSKLNIITEDASDSQECLSQACKLLVGESDLLYLLREEESESRLEVEKNIKKEKRGGGGRRKGERKRKEEKGIEESLCVSMNKLTLNNDKESLIEDKGDDTSSVLLLKLSLKLVTCSYWLLCEENEHCLTLVNNIITSLIKGIWNNDIILPYLIEGLQLKVRYLLVVNKFSETTLITTQYHEMLSIAHSFSSYHPALRLQLSQLHYHIAVSLLLNSQLIDTLCNEVGGVTTPTMLSSIEVAPSCDTSIKRGKVVPPINRDDSIALPTRRTRKIAPPTNKVTPPSKSINVAPPTRRTKRQPSSKENKAPSTNKPHKILSTDGDSEAPPIKRTTKKRRPMRISDDEEDESIEKKEKEKEKKEEEKEKGEELSSQLRSILIHLLEASTYLTPPTLSTCLYRDVYQLLGLCLSNYHNGSHLSSHFLILSCSVSINQQSVYWFGKKIRKESSLKSIINNILSTLNNGSSSSNSTPLVQARLMLHPLPHPHPVSYTRYLINSRLPKDWVYCSLSLIQVYKEIKVLVILRVESGKDPLLVKVPIHDKELLTDFNDLLKDSKQNIFIVKEKKEWWTTRISSDKELEKLLLKLESTWLGPWKIILLSTLPQLFSSSFSSLSSLLTKCGVSDAWADILVGGAKVLTSRELQVVLRAFTVNSTSVTVAELLSAVRNAKSTPGPSRPLIISLSHHIQGLPLENIPLLSDQLVTRMPSLPFLSAHLLLQTTREGVDPAQTYYVINPSGDLVNTQERFERCFGREEGWNGVVGRPPSSDEFVNGLKNHDTFIYFGHGQAREYLGREQRLQELHTSATVLQMGCSSGKLECVGSLDPQGMALNFLISGCPFLVANLWDVTDADIDRFCTSVLQNWLTKPSTHHQEGGDKRNHIDLLHNITEARNSCRLRYLIGASPVVYGLPVH